MSTADAFAPERRSFEADVAQLLQLMVHSVYSDRDVFLRELISNAADACEKLRFEAIAHPALLGDDPKPRITLLIDAENRRLDVELDDAAIARRLEAWEAPALRYTTGVMAKYAATVAQAHEGAITRPLWP